MNSPHSASLEGVVSEEANSEVKTKSTLPRRIVSGIQPSGEFHVGNYLGAIRNWVNISKEAKAREEEAFFCIADAHAITVPYKAKDLQKRILQMSVDLVACGVDPEETVFFIQSDVKEHMELAWYLASVTPLGDLDRMTQFKDKSAQQEFVSCALYTYPVLMSADILLYRATTVPVGDDQLQHLELARETVRRFNHRFGRTFPEPQPLLTKATRIMGLDGDGKMSKSKGNTLGLFEDSNTFWKKLKTAYTDPQRVQREDPGRPDVCNMFTMHKELSSESEQIMVRTNCESAAWGCYHCKELLFQNFEKELVPLRKKRAEIDPEALAKTMRKNADRARAVASQTVSYVRKNMGLGSL